MRMIIAGSRGADREEDYQALKAYVMANCAKPSEIVSGTTKGGDLQGERLAAEFGIPVTRMPADWNKHGKGAGYLRNGDMAVYASEVPGSALVALWDGESADIKNMISVAGNYGLAVHVIKVQPAAAQPGASVRDVTPQAPYIFPQSYSSMNVFDTCPRQYEAKYITKEVQYVQSPEAKWGDDVHMELEYYIKQQGNHQLSDKCLDPNGSGLSAASFKQQADWVLARAAAAGGQIVAERQLGVDDMAHSCSYKDKRRRFGGKIDITILYPQRGVAEVFDWKTGKIRDDRTQLQFYAGLILAHHRDINTVGAGYVWLAQKQISPPSFYTRADYYQHWDTFQHKYARLKEAYVRGVFEPTPNGLCKQWCDVKSCEFHGKGRR